MKKIRRFVDSGFVKKHVMNSLKDDDDDDEITKLLLQHEKKNSDSAKAAGGLNKGKNKLIIGVAMTSSLLSL